MVPDLEITIEVNPATVDPNGLKYLSQAGVNRISLGIQSFDDNELAVMGRRHSASDGLAVFELARTAGFENISIDLIAGFPGQSLASMRRILTAVLELGPEHLSIYLLEVKEGTALEACIRNGQVQAPDDDLAASLYEYICETVVGSRLRALRNIEFRTSRTRFKAQYEILGRRYLCCLRPGRSWDDGTKSLCQY